MPFLSIYLEILHGQEKKCEILQNRKYFNVSNIEYWRCRGLWS